MQITEAFSVVVQLADKLGVKKINEIEGCWEVDINEKWSLALNGHREPTKDSHGCEVPPFQMAVTYNGCPAGIIGPHGGFIFSGGEDEFIAAVKERLAASNTRLDS